MIVQAKRHLAKTISYRMVSTTVGFFITWYLTNNIEFGLTFSVLELIIKPAIYYLHERFWYRWIKYGLKK